MKTLPRILIATSYYDAPKFIYHMSEDNIFRGNGSLFHGSKFIAQTGEPEMFRNNAVLFAVQDAYDYIFFADADMSFPHGIVAELLRIFSDYKDEKPYAASGIYALRKTELVNSVFHWDGDGFTSDVLWPESAFDYEHIFRADGCATGCMLLRVKLFETVLKDYMGKWFTYLYTDSATQYVKKWSEDMMFSKLCYERGIKFYINPKLPCGHELRSVQLFPSGKEEFRVDLGLDVTINLKRKQVEINDGSVDIKHPSKPSSGG